MATTSITCPQWVKAQDKACAHYQQGGFCNLPSQFRCVEYLKAKTHLSYSSISSYMKCPKKFQLRHVLGIKPLLTPAPLALGQAAHLALATLHGENGGATALEPGLPPEDAAKLRAVVAAYGAGGDYPRGLTEQRFCSPDNIIGVIDLALPDCFWEHKYSGRPDCYQNKHRISFQLGIYFLGYPQAERCVMNVLRHPQLKYNEDKESEEEFEARCTADIQRRPKHYFLRTTYYKQEFDLRAVQAEIVAWKDHLALSLYRGVFPHAYSSCWGLSACEYIQYCNLGPEATKDIYTSAKSKGAIKEQEEEEGSNDD